MSRKPSKLDLEVEADFLRRVRPIGWINPPPKSSYDLVIVGAGPAGLAAVQTATRLGATVALIDKCSLGGTSLNSGSVPSKALIHCETARQAMRAVDEFGEAGPLAAPPKFAAAMERMRRVRTRISEYNCVDRLVADGVDVFFGEARFISPDALAVDGARLSFDKALIATGARARPATIPGLEAVGYHTNSTIFDLEVLPERLVVIGGGPLGCEMAQAFCRLGSHVAIIQNDPKFLPREERDAAQLLSAALDRDGVEIRLNTTVVGARLQKGSKIVDTESYGAKAGIRADAILLSIGRQANFEDLGLHAAGIETVCDGVKVDDYFRTSNQRVFAAGDVCMDYRFSNAADQTGRMATRNALDNKRQGRSGLTIPWCTFCDPEIAHIGLDVRQARERSIPVQTFTVMMQDVDRAIIDGKDDGFVKIHVADGTDRIIGASIVASCASEMINEISVLMSADMGMRDLAEVVHVYPAQSAAIKTVAMNFIRGAAARG